MPHRPALSRPSQAPAIAVSRERRLASAIQRGSVLRDVRFLNNIIDAVADPIMVKDEQLRFLLVNQALCDFTGIPREQFIGRTDADLHDAEHARVFNAMDRRVLDTGEPNVNEETHTHADGSIRTIRTTKTIFIDAEGHKVLVGIFIDLTAWRTSQRELELANQRLHELAHHDSLTNLPNRMAFEAALAQDLSLCQRQGGGFSVLFMDLNGFKQINDTHGHGVGDELIRFTGQRLLRCARETDFVARLGGDEFVVIARNTTPESAARVAERLAGEIAQPFALSVGEVNVSVSIGCATYPQHGQAQTELIRNADTAMYRAKRVTGQAFELYDESQSMQTKLHDQMLQLLREDIEAGRIDIHVQPVVDLADAHTLGYEALARWSPDGLGAVPPSVFIPLAENLRLIGQLGRLVLYQACQFIASHGEVGQYVSVNVSALQLEDPSFADTVLQVLEDTGIQPRQLALELTETSFAPPSSEDVLRRLHDAGVALFVDDFGVGYSNLRRLQWLPFDAIKIDRGFVSDLGRDGGGTAMIRTMVVLAHELGLKLIAEGIEDEHQAQRLRSLGVQSGQGYLYGRPAPVPECPSVQDRPPHRS